VAYLPDTPEGRKVLALLVKAFERRFTFIVGTSVTTGKANTVVWAGIHHKTNTHGGTSHFGYPDPTYFNRVQLELADRGVTLDSDDEIAQIVNNSVG
jgi:deltex-like protein